MQDNVFVIIKNNHYLQISDNIFFLNFSNYKNLVIFFYYLS